MDEACARCDCNFIPHGDQLVRMKDQKIAVALCFVDEKARPTCMFPSNTQEKSSEQKHRKFNHHQGSASDFLLPEDFQFCVSERARCTSFKVVFWLVSWWVCDFKRVVRMCAFSVINLGALNTVSPIGSVGHALPVERKSPPNKHKKVGIGGRHSLAHLPPFNHRA